MKQKKRVSQILMVAVLCVLIVYIGFHMNKKKEWMTQENRMELSSFLLRQAEMTYLPAFAKVSSGDRGLSPANWLARNAAELIPLGTYMEELDPAATDVEDKETYEMILAKQAADENAVDADGKLIGEEESKEVLEASAGQSEIVMEDLKDPEYLISHFYTIDSSTSLKDGQLNAEKLLGKDMKLNKEKEEPKVLIYHTHSQEAFQDSRSGEVSDTIMGMGAYLTKILNDTYGIPTLHHEGVYDLIDGNMDRSKAYQLAEPQVQKILKENPSIEVVIDLHRDGVGESTHLVTDIGGKKTAQIMFFNGLSRSKANGDIGYLKNPYIEDNLAFSLQMQLAAARMYPGFTRRIYLKSYRYNMHLKPKSLLIEAGAQTNTVEEMKNAMVVLAKTLDSVLDP